MRRAFLVIYLACTMGLNAVALIPRNAQGEAGDNTVFAASWILLHLSAAVLLATRRGRGRGRTLLALAVGGWLMLGALWSVAPQATVVYGAMAAGNIVVAAVAAEEFSLRRLLQLMLAVLTVLTAAGLLLHLLGVDQVVDFDSHGRQNYLGGDRTRALFQHNITAGFHGAAGIALSAALLRGPRRVGALALFALLVLMAGSATGLVLAVLATLLVPTVKLLAPRIPLGPLVLIGQPLVLVGAVCLSVFWTPLMNALGRDPTMTGRTQLWAWGLRTVAERPILGWGFDAYFRSSLGDAPSRYVPRFDGYAIDHFHNAFLQTAVDVGLIGLIALLAALGVSLVRAYRMVRRGGRNDADVGAAALTLLMLLIVGGFGEVLFPSANEFGMFALFLLVFGLARTGGGASGRAGREATDSDHVGSRR